jgi:hypothetical protein
VKRANPNTANPECGQPPTHLARGPICESHGERAGWVMFAARHGIGNAMSDCPRLSGTGAGHDDNRTADRLSNLALFRVQPD